jgi:hypothetical protein
MIDNDIFLMVGKTVGRIIGEKGSDELIFECTDGTVFRFYHDQDCCECCAIDDVVGSFNDLIGSPITMAEEVSSEGAPDPENADFSFTWTFYKFATLKGYVTVKWLGQSNGYYSESVDLSITNG